MLGCWSKQYLQTLKYKTSIRSIIHGTHHGHTLVSNVTSQFICSGHGHNLYDQTPYVKHTFKHVHAHACGCLVVLTNCAHHHKCFQYGEFLPWIKSSMDSSSEKSRSSFVRINSCMQHAYQSYDSKYHDGKTLATLRVYEKPAFIM